MGTVRLVYGRLDAAGAGVLPANLEGIDYLLLDGGSLAPPDDQRVENVLLDAVERLAPSFYLDPGLHVIASLAGRDPRAAARAIARRLSESADLELPIAAVRGQDLLGRLEEVLEAGDLAHALTGAPYAESRAPIVAAVAELGHEPALAALSEGARLVLVSCESPAELVVACVRAAFGPETVDGSLADRAADLGNALVGTRLILARGMEPAHDLAVAKSFVAEFADDGRTEFYGSTAAFAWATETARQPRHTESQQRIHLLLNHGWILSATVKASDQDVLERLLKFLSFDNLEWSEDEQYSLWLRTDDCDKLVQIHAEYASQSDGESALRIIKQVIGIPGPGYGLEILACPTLRPIHREWPTQYGPIELDWAVDTRAAREWLD